MSQKLKVLKVVTIGIGIIMSILITGCVEKPSQNGDSVNTSTSAPFFPVQKDPNPACYMTAELVGELVIENGCFRVGDYLLVWPHGFSVSTENGVIQIIDDNGQPIIRVGDKIKLGGGGGEMSSEHIAIYSAELPCDRCSGPYWIVGDVLKSD
ncbi:MAG: hypothetical protein ACT6FG_07395 [Methanosarcinaceae archaeon]